MGLFRPAPKSEPPREVLESPHKKICHDMAEDSKLFALYSKEGTMLVDHFGKSSGGGLDVTQPFYLAMNLNFVQYFSNSVKVGVYNTNGLEMLSPNLASFKPVYHLGEDAVIYTNSKEKGFKVSMNDYEKGILVMLLKLPKEWNIASNGQLRVKLQSSLLFNPTEMDTFLLKMAV